MLVYALVRAFDHGYGICETLEELMGRRIEIQAFVDSRTIFSSIAKNSATAERSSQTDV